MLAQLTLLLQVGQMEETIGRKNRAIKNVTAKKKEVEAERELMAEAVKEAAGKIKQVREHSLLPTAALPVCPASANIALCVPRVSNGMC